MATATSLKYPSLTSVHEEHSASESRIDSHSHINGLYETRQDLRIEGVAEGDIQCEGTLTVAEGARVKAKVTASTITIAGTLEGEVVCRGVFQIMPSGQVDATVSARRLIVQEGGLYNGEFRMITDEAAPQKPVLVSQPRAKAPKEDRAPTRPAGTLSSDEWWAKMTGDLKDEPPKDDASSHAAPPHGASSPKDNGTPD